MARARATVKAKKKKRAKRTEAPLSEGAMRAAIMAPMGRPLTAEEERRQEIADRLRRVALARTFEAATLI